MEITTKFNLEDTAYLIENYKAYKCKILNIKTSIDTNDKVIIKYDIEKTISKWLFDEEISILRDIREEKLFLSKQEVKEKLEEIKVIKQTAETNQFLYWKENKESIADRLGCIYDYSYLNARIATWPWIIR